MLLSWYNMCQNKGLADKGTGWDTLKLVEGEFIPEPPGWIGSMYCLFSSPYRDFVIDFSKEILDQGFDGLWYDGAWAGSQDAPSCYCPYCREAFREEFHAELPTVVDWEAPLFRQWVHWRYRRFDEFVTRLYHELVTHKPEAIVMMNHYNRPDVHSTDPAVGINWKNGVSIDVMQFPGGGGNENTCMTGRLHSTGFNGRIVKAQCPDRWDVWQPGGQLWRMGIQDLEVDKTHAILHGVWTLALGGVPWTAGESILSHLGHPDPTLMDAMKRRRPVIGGTPVTYCAVHYSQAARDFWGRNTPNAYYSEVYGLYEIAVEAHVPVDLILDGHLEDPDYVRRYAVIVLPNSACLSARQVEVLRQYVADGGVLLASYETSLYSEDGDRQADFQLADVFGAHYEGTTRLTPGEWGPTIYDRDNYPLEIHPLRVLDKDFAQTVARAVFFGANYTRGTPESSAEIFCMTYDSTQGGLGSAYAPLNAGEQAELLPSSPLDIAPGVMLNHYGQGYCAYFAPEAGHGFLQWPYTESRRLLERFLLMGHPEITVQAPKIVEMAAFWKTPDTLAVHLVNLPANSNRPPVPAIGIPVMDELNPVDGIVVTVPAPPTAEVRVSLPLSGDTPHVTREDGKLVITVPRLRDHEVVWIEGLQKPA